MEFCITAMMALAAWSLLAAGLGGDSTGWLLAAITTLGGAIAALWRQVIQYHKETKQDLASTKKKLDECEDDRTELWREVTNLKAKTDVND